MDTPKTEKAHAAMKIINLTHVYAQEDRAVVQVNNVLPTNEPHLSPVESMIEH